MWLGRELPAQFLQAVFGANALELVDSKMVLSALTLRVCCVYTISNMKSQAAIIATISNPFVYSYPCYIRRNNRQSVKIFTITSGSPTFRSNAQGHSIDVALLIYR